MKTFTEFSTLVLRRAAAAKAANASLEGDAFAEALAAALSIAADRVPRVLEALEIAGDNLDAVRLVRVYQGETGPHGAVSRGEFHYAVDRVIGGGRGGDRRERRPERGERGERGGDRGGDRGDRRDKPRGLGSLIKAAAGVKDDSKEDDRPQRGEIPRAGIGWQLTSAPREARDDRGGPRGRGGKRPGGPGRGRPPRDAGGPGGPGGPGGDRPRGPRPQGDRPRGPRPEGAPGGGARPVGDRPAQARPPRDPNAPRRERKPLGPDANGMGPDGTPWDPERKRKRDEERASRLAAGGPAAAAPAAEAPAATEK